MTWHPACSILLAPLTGPDWMGEGVTQGMAVRRRDHRRPPCRQATPGIMHNRCLQYAPIFLSPCFPLFPSIFKFFLLYFGIKSENICVSTGISRFLLQMFALKERFLGPPRRSSGLDSVLPLQVVQVWSLAGELRSHRPTWLGQKKKKRLLLEGKGNILELDNGDGCIRLWIY